MSKTEADDLCQVRCFNIELVTQIRSTFPSEDTLEEMTVIFNALADRLRVRYFMPSETAMSFVFAILLPC